MWIYVDDLNRIYRCIQHFDVVTINPEYSKNFILLRPFLDALFALDVVFRLNVCRTLDALEPWQQGGTAYPVLSRQIYGENSIDWFEGSDGPRYSLFS